MLQKPLRVGVDCTPLQPPFTGVGNFALFLLDALTSTNAGLELDGFARLSWKPIDRAYLQETARRAGKLLHGCEPHPHPTASLRSVVDLPLSSAAISALRSFVRALPPVDLCVQAAKGIAFRPRRRARQLFHAFNYRAPARSDVPVIPLVYDLSFVRYPDAHPPQRLRALEPLAREIEAAPLVQTISQFSAAEISDVFGIARSRIVVTYPGVAPVFHVDMPPRDATLRRFALTRGAYALTAATLEPRKNLRTLIAAYAQLKPLEQARLPLCIAGPRGWGDIALPSQSRVLEKEGTLRFLGYVGEAELRDLYAGARVMLYPSLYEGFGMPVIEALACGAPVVASATSSLPEAAGRFARLIDPLDVDAWTRELRCALDDGDKRDEAAARARRAHALSFTWAQAADATLRMYQTVIASTG